VHCDGSVTSTTTVDVKTIKNVSVQTIDPSN
jgi:hypothetical protein